MAAALKFTGIIFLLLLAVINNAHAGKRKKCCQRVETKIDALTVMVENLDCQAPASACPEGWAHHEDSCYLVIDIPTLKWSHARRTCQDLGGDLAIIRSEDENNFISDLVMQQETVHFFGAWLGLHRNASADNHFYWVDGTPLAGQYSAWTPGAPNHPLERCGCMYGAGTGSRQGQWDDISCDWGQVHLDRVPVLLCKKKSN